MPKEPCDAIYNCQASIQYRDLASEPILARGSSLVSSITADLSESDASSALFLPVPFYQSLDLMF